MPYGIFYKSVSRRQILCERSYETKTNLAKTQCTQIVLKLLADKYVNNNLTPSIFQVRGR